MEKQASIENVIIIGSGPAGLTAAIYTARANLNPLVIEGEEAGGQLMLTTDVENYPGFPKGVTGPELMMLFREQASRFGARFITKNVTRVDLKARPFRLWVGNQEYQSRAVIISTGASAKYLGLESEKKYMSRGVSACATCDGAFFKGLDVAVVGGGDTAMEEAQFLTRFANKVYIIHRRDQFRASKIMADRVLKNPKIQVLWNRQVVEVLGNEKHVTGLILESTQDQSRHELKVDGLFLAIGHKPNTDLFKEYLELNEVGYIKTRPGSTYTNVTGVFACGDVQDPTYRQAITAAGSGCMAAIDCERWLESQEH
ncbi:MAG: thioredoxin-disulfide reductase [Bdellovibrionaceae bacterium]|jgi:thioredoxin reductase (NADPH)|nr:thioredoxin-disulfide reductase [Pseudobdellovibrionaceae bacterium]